MNTAQSAARVIRRYPNRRLYDTASSSYVSLAEVKAMVLAHEPLIVLDSKSGDNVTRATLLQVLLEEESAGVGLMSEQALAHLIRFYGQGSTQAMAHWFEQAVSSMAGLHRQMQHAAGESARATLGAMPSFGPGTQAPWLTPWLDTAQSMMRDWSGVGVPPQPSAPAPEPPPSVAKAAGKARSKALAKTHLRA